MGLKVLINSDLFKNLRPLWNVKHFDSHLKWHTCSHMWKIYIPDWIFEIKKFILEKIFVFLKSLLSFFFNEANHKDLSCYFFRKEILFLQFSLSFISTISSSIYLVFYCFVHIDSSSLYSPTVSYPGSPSRNLSASI